MAYSTPSIKKEDTTPFTALSGRDPLDELADTQRRRIEEMRQNKRIGWGSLPSLTTRRTGDANPGTGPADLMSRLGATFGTLGRSEHAVEFYQQALGKDPAFARAGPCRVRVAARSPAWSSALVAGFAR